MTNELSSVIRVRPKNSMRAGFKLLHTRDSDLDSGIYIRYKQESKLSSRVIVPYVKGHDLTSVIRVPFVNKLYGYFDLRARPIITLNLLPVMDAFVKQSALRFNYGKSGDLIIGYNKNDNDTYRSFLEFDVAQIPRNKQIISVKLKLYNPQLTYTEKQIDVYTVGSVWYENDITWVNQPNDKDFVTSVTVLGTPGTLEIDVTDAISRRVQGQEYTFGLLLKATQPYEDSIARFYSKEMGMNSPVLEVKYFGDILDELGFGDLTAKVTSRALSKHDLTSTIFTQGMNIGTGDLESIIAIKHDTLNSSIIVKQHSSINASLIVQHTWLSDIDSHIQISKAFVHSSLIVQQQDKHEIPASIIPRIKSTSNIELTITVNRPITESTIIVRQQDKLDIGSSIVVQYMQYTDMSSVLGVSKPNIFGTIFVQHVADRESTIIVRRKSTSMINALMTVMITDYKDLNLTMQVVHSNSIGASMLVVSGFLKSTIKVPYIEANDLNATLLPRLQFASDLVSQLIVISGSSGGGSGVGAYAYII